MKDPVRVLAIDPGLRELGMAVFEDGVLIRAGLIRNPEIKHRGPTAWQAIAAQAQSWFLGSARYLVTEYPQVYTAKGQKGDQSDLIEVAGVAGAVLGAMFERCGEFVGFLPRTWKSNVPKDIHNRRVMAKLSEAEKATMEPCPGHLLHNQIDAVGIGMFFVTKKGMRK